MPKVYLKDYKPSDYTITDTYLHFDLDSDNTKVSATLSIKKQNLDSNAPLTLNGGNFELEHIALNKKILTATDYTINDNDLTLHATPEQDFELTIITRLNPKNNKTLNGLYETNDIMTTHCEAEGFRNITYYLDRPDVLAKFTTSIQADKNKFPILLSNGNIIRSGVEGSKHFVVYQDPIPKPSYLFALVSGQLALREDFFVTRSGRRVTLRIFVPEKDNHKTAHAMEALKAAMRFDEEHYDREYDLEIYNIVGVPQFNAGAMENKGLNIFNDSYLLAHPDMTTDDAYEVIYSVVGHEYFHNWRGNRVTVKNWFQLSLKEGFATITEQEFLQSLTNSQVSRIDNVVNLQSTQFKDDSGPLAHPVMPPEYEAPDNIYTSTIYQKGSEVLNMLKSLLGKDTFKKGCSIYFAENDGKAANIEDFLSAMEQASGKNLSQFLLWYQQSGTPHLSFEEKYDADKKIYHLTATQTLHPTQDQKEKQPMLIPIALGLLNSKGQDIELQLEGEEKSNGTTRTIELTQASQTFSFVNVAEKPVPSLLRHFSAPVKITKSPVTSEELKFLLKYDSDPVNRWFAARNIARQSIIAVINDLQNGKQPQVDPVVIDAFRSVLIDEQIEPRLVESILTFPDAGSFFDDFTPVNPGLICQGRNYFVKTFIDNCYVDIKNKYLNLHASNVSSAYSPEAASVRGLKNLCLSFLLRSNKPEATDLCLAQLHAATNMTETLGALRPLAYYHHEDRVALRAQELEKFFAKWQHDTNTVKHYFRLHASSNAPDALEQIIKITQSSAFKKEIPSQVYALIYAFFNNNMDKFHDPSGAAYKFVADSIIEIDKINASTASHLARAFGNWKKLEPVRREKMLEQLFRVHYQHGLSKNVKELIGKSVQEALAMKNTKYFASVPSATVSTYQEEKQTTTLKIS